MSPTPRVLNPHLLQALGDARRGAGRLSSLRRGAGGRGTWELPLGAGIGGLPAQGHPKVGWFLPFHHHLLLGPGDSVSNHLGHLPLIPAATLEKVGVAVLGESISSAPSPPPFTIFTGLGLLGLRGSPGSRPCAHSPASLTLQRMAEEARETALPVERWRPPRD